MSTPIIPIMFFQNHSTVFRLITALLCFPFDSFAAEPRDISNALEDVRARNALPAVGAAVVENGRIVAMGATGRRRLDRDVAVTTSDKWHIGSCTKSMTAVLVGVLVDVGKLRWDMTVAEALPGVEMHPAWRGVTLDHLLTQRAGVPEISRAQWTAMERDDGAPQEQRIAFARALLARPPVQAPGKSFAYSNVGYGLLGAIIERAAGQPYEELLSARIFKPLVLTSAGFGAPATKGRLDQPWGHYRNGDNLIAASPVPENGFPPALAPAACVHLSLADFARYAAWLGTNEPRLVSTETFRHLQTPPGDSAYACGQWRTEVPGIGPVLAHTGHLGGFFGVFYTSSHHAVVVVFNTEGGGWEWLGDEIAALAVKTAK